MRKSGKFIVLTILAVAILWFFSRGLNWAEVWQSLQKADIWQVFLATLIICAGYLFRAYRWQTLLAPITPASIRELFATTTVGYAAVFLVGRAGELVRPMWLPMRDRRVRPSAAFVTIGLERVLDLLALVVLSAVNFVWYTAPAGREAEFEYIRRLGYLMLVGAVVGVIALVVFHKFSAQFNAWFEPFILKLKFLPHAVKRILISLAKSLAASLAVFKSPKELLITIFWTFVLWMAISIPTWLMLRAFDLPLGFGDAIFVMGFASIGSLVPTPGGAAGAFHAVTMSSLIFLNVDRETAAACSIVMHLVYFAPAIIFGIYYFLNGDISISRLKSLLDPTEVPEIDEREISVSG